MEAKLDCELDVTTDNRADGPESRLDPRNRLNDLTATEWIAETVSVFTQKGLGQNHPDAQIEKQHPAPFSFQDVARLIRFFTKQGGKVLDPFCGVASTLKACALTGRRGVGIELNERYVELGNLRLRSELEPSLFSLAEQRIIHGDALHAIDEFQTGEFDFLVTSPPYWNILHKVDHKARQERIRNGLDSSYGAHPADLGNIGAYDEFVDVLGGFFDRVARVLRPKSYVCVVVSDFRHKDRFFMFHADLAQRMEERLFHLKGITVLYQNRKRVFPYGYPFAYVPNVHHQYILIMQKRS